MSSIVYDEARPPTSSPTVLLNRNGGDPPELRDYQEAAERHVLESLARGSRSLYFALPTGTGKAVILAALARDLSDRGERVLVVAHREELIHQLAAQITPWVPDPVGVVMAARDELGRAVSVGSIQTLRKPRLDRLIASSPAPVGALLIDEAHHITARNSYATLIERLREHNPRLAVIGCTATPYRSDREVMQTVLPFCAFERTIEDMQEAGWLAPLRQKRVRVPMRLAHLLASSSMGSGEPDYAVGALELEAMRPEVLQALVEGTVKHIGARVALAFAVDVAHARALADAYGRAGIAAAAVWGEMPHADRVRTLADWRAGRLQLVANCGILTEGFDYPDIACLVMARPTRSLVLYTQMIGRGTRLAEGKPYCMVLEATPGKPDPAQVTLGDVVPVVDDEEGDAGDETSDAAKSSNRERRLTLLDPRHDHKYRWLYLEGAHTYVAGVDHETTLYLVRDPDDEHGSGLYRAALLGRDKRVASVDGLSFPVSLRVAQRRAREWLDDHAQIAIAGRVQAWHHEPASEKQMAFLSKYLRGPGGRRVRKVPSDLTRERAGELITRVIAGWNVGLVREALWSAKEQSA